MVNDSTDALVGLLEKLVSIGVREAKLPDGTHIVFSDAAIDAALGTGSKRSMATRLDDAETDEDDAGVLFMSSGMRPEDLG